jgi:hypothetical protein
MLIDTMEQVSREQMSRPGMRALPCDRTIVSALSLQLARPAAPYPHWHARPFSDFSLRN